MIYNDLSKKLIYYRLLIRYIVADKSIDNNKYIKDLMNEVTIIDKKLKSIDSGLGIKSNPGGNYDPAYFLTVKKFKFFKWIRKLWHN
jgi:hypothetical protein